MKPRVLAVALGLALIGCAQTRSGLPIGRVGLEPESPLDRAIGRTPAPRDPEVIPAGNPTRPSDPTDADAEAAADDEAPATLVLPGLPASATPPEKPRRDPAVVPAAADAGPEPAADAERIPAAQPTPGTISDLKLDAATPAAVPAAQVGETVISLRELKAALREALRQSNKSWDELSRDEKNYLGPLVLNGLIDRTLVVQDARRQVKDKVQWAILMEYTLKAWREKELPGLIRKYKVADEYQLKQALQAEGESLDEMANSFQFTNLAREFEGMKLMEKVEKPGWHELQRYYYEHRHTFDRPEALDWSEIVVRFAMSKERGPALARARAALERLRRGEDFGRVAQAVSEGANASTGGRWKETTPGSYGVAAVNQALAGLRPGQVSPIIEGPSSFHIVRLERRRPAGPRPFVEVQHEIANAILQKNFESERQAYYQKLRERTAISSPLLDQIAAESAEGGG